MPFFSLTGTKYYISPDEQKWGNAREKCQAMGGDLASFNTPAEMALVESIATGIHYIIGLKLKKAEGKFEWVDGSSLTFQKWGYQPSTLSDSCAIMMYMESNEWLWYGHACSVEFNYICEIPSKCTDSNYLYWLNHSFTKRGESSRPPKCLSSIKFEKQG